MCCALILVVTGGLRKFGSVVFALSCAPASFHAYKSMEKKTIRDWNEVSAVAVVSGAAMCIVMGIGTVIRRCAGAEYADD